ncbi:MAG: hypothetical protein ACUZ8O_02135 [Candidatus Anammoxibacter sp.]
MNCVELEFEDGTFCYIDGHDKYVMPSRYARKAFKDIIADVKSGLVSRRITTKRDQAVNLLFDKDPKQQELMANLVNTFFKSSGKLITNAAVFDRNHLIISAINNFSRMRKVFICSLKPDQYNGIKDFEIVEDFRLLKKYEPHVNMDIAGSGTKSQSDLEWVSDARYVVQNKIQDITLNTRVALIVKVGGKMVNIIPVITNIPPTAQFDISKIARIYLDKKQYQDNIFFNLVQTMESDVNMSSQETVTAKGAGVKIRDRVGKKGISMLPDSFEEPVLPPFKSVRSLGDELSEIHEGKK